MTRPSPRPDADVRGLTADQVRERRARGLVNRVTPTTSRPLGAILRGNLLTLYNAVLGAAVLLLLLVAQDRDAFLISALVVFSVTISTVQEIWAKIRLDRIALLAQPRVRVIRDGHELDIPPGEVVRDDCLVLVRGDQVVADGVLIRVDYLELDESAITGEVEAVAKNVGDRVLSGSFCVAGSGIYEATHVGESSYIQTLTAAARRYRNVRTPLQQYLDRVLKVLLAAVIGLSVLQVTAFLIEGVPTVETIRATAVIATLVPQGLLVMSTVAYSLGALRLARHQGLVQQLNAVESLSHVDVLCMDKTGTLTRGMMTLREIIPIDRPEAEVQQIVGAFAASFPVRDSTLQAIVAHCPSKPRAIEQVVPFRPERKWSALTLGSPGPTGTYVLGAPEVLLNSVGNAERARELAAHRAEAGQRVLLFAAAPTVDNVAASDGSTPLPRGLQALALIVLEEDLRNDAASTLEAFFRQGVALKIISGDHPQTVLALARRTGFPRSARAVSGPELSTLAPEEFASTVERTAVFGRTDPQQKRQIIDALKRRGRYVAMLGDGVNDIVAMKEAQIGIAMQSGSPATRGVADMVLLQDSFEALPAALREGRRIVNSMHLLVKLFLVRDVAAIALILATGFLRMPFPLLPPHSTLIALLTVGIPSLFLVVWAEAAPPERDLLLPIVRFVLPLGTAIALATLIVYILTLSGFEADVNQARTAVVTAAILSGLAVLLFLCCPLAAPAKQLFRNRPLLVLVVGTLLAYLGVLSFPALASYFELHPLTLAAWLAVLAVVGTCLVGLRILARYHLVRRIFG